MVENKVDLDNSKAIPVELRDSKVYAKVCKLVGEDKAKELLATDSDVLKSLIYTHTINIANAKAEVASNMDFIRAKDVVDTFRSGLNDTIKPWKSCMDLALAVLSARGEK